MENKNNTETMTTDLTPKEKAEIMRVYVDVLKLRVRLGGPHPTDEEQALVRAGIEDLRRDVTDAMGPLMKSTQEAVREIAEPWVELAESVRRPGC